MRKILIIAVLLLTGCQPDEAPSNAIAHLNCHYGMGWHDFYASKICRTRDYIQIVDSKTGQTHFFKFRQCYISAGSKMIEEC